MNKIFRVKDKVGGMIEVQVFKRNNKVPEDIIWLHTVSRKGKTLEENGMAIKPMEAEYIIHGLFLALSHIIGKYKLYKFKIKSK